MEPIHFAASPSPCTFFSTKWINEFLKMWPILCRVGFSPPFFHSDKLGRGVALSNLPVIRRSWCTHPDCCTTLLGRQVLDLLSLFLCFPDYLPWCHFSSPELASLPRISVEKRICIIYKGIFQLLSNLSHLVILLFHLLLLCLFSPLHLSSTQEFPLLLWVICFSNQSPTCHPPSPSLSLHLRIRLPRCVS